MRLAVTLLRFAIAALALFEGVARAQSFADPRSFGFVTGRGGAIAGAALGIVGLGAAIRAAGVRRFHSRGWLRPWRVTVVLAVPLLLAGAPLVAGAIAGRYLSGDPVGDMLVMASTRFIALAAAAGWLIYEIMAGVRQHDNDLYTEQRPHDRSARIMRTLAALLGIILALALALGVSVTVIPKL